LAPQRPPLQLTILHTNDHHGRFWPHPDGAYGMAARKTVIDRIRAEVAAACGHSQNPVCMLNESICNAADRPGEPCAPDRQNCAWIVQAQEWGQSVGRADFVIDAGRVNLVKYALIPINLKQAGADGQKVVIGEAIPEDPALRSFLLPFHNVGQERLLVPVGQTDGVFDGDRVRVRSQPTTLGVLIARAMQDRTGADLAVINSGGVRDSLPAGRITYRDVLKVQPFANTVGVLTLTGANASQSTTSTSAGVQQIHQLAGSGARQVNTGTAAAVSQVHVLQAAPVAVDHIAAAGAVVQTHLLAANDVAQANTATDGQVIEGVYEPDPDRIIVVRAEPRIALVEPESRIILVKPESRTIAA
jgi:5'-nucleotidase/UDP-sugar diphosphatase